MLPAELERGNINIADFSISTADTEAESVVLQRKGGGKQHWWKRMFNVERSMFLYDVVPEIMIAIKESVYAGAFSSANIDRF